MKIKTPVWIVGLVATLAIITIPIILFIPDQSPALDNPASALPQRPEETNHAALLPGPYASGAEVTRACLDCHPEAASQVMQTTHWTWESEPFEVSWRDEPVTIGKINQLNNFCISAQGNQKSCMSCHVGYGWEEGAEPFDFSNAENVDCLVCHAQTGYAKGSYGNPAEGSDLVAAAQSVSLPTRENCGTCHFNGGGGNNVKHGDLSEALYYPDATTDVHMGAYDFQCIDCHQTSDHQIKGRLVVDNMVIDPAEQVACTDCHTGAPHTDERVNNHTTRVACQTCHIPSFANDDPTKMVWDWSTSGQDIAEDHYTYLKIKGSFQYASEVQPSYLWFNGNLDYRYLLGDPINPDGPTLINDLAGDINDLNAKIYPFKIHQSFQPYDTVNNYLLAPITAGPEGYWTNFDWDLAFELAEAVTGLEYSGEYGFTETLMFWPTTHQVQPATEALQCADCHGENGRMDWLALGYPGDPLLWGGRSQVNP
jgi:octaheme c-type cytochrome (tetrathionate reductase family)